MSMIVGMCNPLLDISADVPMDFLGKYKESHVPMYNEMVKEFPVQYIAGGAGLNSMRVAQWMLQIPNKTAYFGAIGVDNYGETLEDCALPTGTCGVLINGGERSLVANLAAANTFSEGHLQTQEAAALIESASIYYVTGFFLTVSVDSILTLAKDASENNKIFTMNLSAPFLIQFFGTQLASCIPYTDYIFANESEAEAYGEAKGYGKDLETIALKLAAQPKATGTRPRIVVFTQGSKSTIVACEGKVTSYDVDPLPKEMLVDTNGAGDAFVGGFLAMLALDKPVGECVRAGHFAARTIIQRSGCTFPEQCQFV
eukprot:GSChrysophyteH1.ASY1.ANO1.3000.1 assembled CDS